MSAAAAVTAAAAAVPFQITELNLYAACSCDLWTQKTVSLEKRLRIDWTKQRKNSRAAATAALVFSI